MMKWDMYLHKFPYLGILKQLITLYVKQSMLRFTKIILNGDIRNRRQQYEQFM